MTKSRRACGLEIFMGLFSIFARIFAFQESQGHHGNLKIRTKFRAVVSRGAVGALGPSEFGSSFN